MGTGDERGRYSWLKFQAIAHTIVGYDDMARGYWVPWHMLTLPVLYSLTTVTLYAILYTVYLLSTVRFKSSAITLYYAMATAYNRT